MQQNETNSNGPETIVTPALDPNTIKPETTTEQPKEECQKTPENKCENLHQKECKNSQKSEDEKLHSLLNKVPRWLRIVLSIALLVAAYKWFPVLEILQVFCFVVIVPLLILSLVGVITADTYNAIVEAMDNVKDKVKQEAQKAATV
jgi:Flp pilus assembly protein TadB